MQKEAARVLIADDDAFIRDIIADIVRANGFTADKASDGKEALGKYNSGGTPFDLIIADLHMPELGGLDLVKSLRGVGDDVPVIILTGDEDVSAAVEAIKAGADDYVIKGEHIESTILISIGKTLEKYRYQAMNKELIGELESMSTKLAKKNEQLEGFNKALDATIRKMTHIGTSLTSEKNLSKLLEMIVLEVRDVSNADGVTLYTVRNNHLNFEIVVNKSMKRFMGGATGGKVTFPPMPLVESNVSACCAVRNETINISDVYASERFDFTGPKKFDASTGYRTKSMLVLPITDRNNYVIGVLQLVNCTDLETGGVVDFGGNIVDIAYSIACQAGVCIENARSYETIERKKLAFERFVPTEFLSYMGKAEVEDIKLGDATSGELSVMFSDIRSFTTISEVMTPEENLEFLNEYLNVIGPVIARNGGFIDKYIGDAIMALFAGTNSGVADDAVAAAVNMQEKLAEFNESPLMKLFSFPLKVGIGVHTGPLTLGTVGFEKRMDSTVIGDTVNLASRVEGLTKRYGIDVAITSNVLRQLKNPSAYLVREIDTVKVKGKEKEATIYEVFNTNDHRTRDLKMKTIEKYNEGLHLYKQSRYKDALGIFRELQAKLDTDKAIGIYLDRCTAACGN